MRCRRSRRVGLKMFDGDYGILGSICVAPSFWRCGERPVRFQCRRPVRAMQKFVRSGEVKRGGRLRSTSIVIQRSRAPSVNPVSIPASKSCEERFQQERPHHPSFLTLTSSSFISPSPSFLHPQASTSAALVRSPSLS